MSQSPSETSNSLVLEPRGGSGEMFDSIAARYDLLNRLMSFGIDKRWRKMTVDALELGEDAKVLDHATGTGDLALDIARTHLSADVTALDPSAGMLGVGRKKLARTKLSDRVHFDLSDSQQIDAETDSFDALTMAFGIRNVPERNRALCEFARVVKPGGRIAILELTEAKHDFMGFFARLHVHHVVPLMGSLLSGSREYRPSQHLCCHRFWTA